LVFVRPQGPVFAIPTPVMMPPLPLFYLIAPQGPLLFLIVLAFLAFLKKVSFGMVEPPFILTWTPLSAF